MAITNESWQTLAQIGEDLAGIVRKLATQGHVDSIDHALTSGAIVHGSVGAKAHMARAMLPLFDDRAPAAQVAASQALLGRFFEQAGGQDIVQQTLLGAGHGDTEVSAGGFAALIKAGGDPWREGPGGEPSPVASVFIACLDEQFAKNRAPKVLAGLLPDLAITTLKSPPKMTFPGMAIFGVRTQVSMLEASIMRSNREIADWLLSRVPPGNDEVYLQLGDRVMQMLEIVVENGHARHTRSMFGETQGPRLAAACRLLARGAQMRDGKVAWDAVATVQNSLTVSGPDDLVAWLCRGPFGPNTTVHPDDRKDALCSIFRSGSVDINATDKQGRTPLMHACVAVLPDMVEAFLLMGADPSVRSKSEHDENETAEEIVRRVISRSSAMQIEERTRMIEMLRAASLRQAVEKTIQQGRPGTANGVKP